MADDCRCDVRGYRAVERHILQHHRNDDLGIIRRRESDEPRVVELYAVLVYSRLRGAGLSSERDSLDGGRRRRSTRFGHTSQRDAKLAEVGVAELEQLLPLCLLAYHFWCRCGTIGGESRVESRHVDDGLRIVALADGHVHQHATLRPVTWAVLLVE